MGHDRSSPRGRAVARISAFALCASVVALAVVVVIMPGGGKADPTGRLSSTWGPTTSPSDSTSSKLATASMPSRLSASLTLPSSVPPRPSTTTSYEDDGPSPVCAVAGNAVDVGELDYAATLYAAIPATAPYDCAVPGLHKIAIQRQSARDKVSLGQQELLSGRFEDAGKDFRAALALDNANSAAQQGLAQVAQFGPPNSPVFNWNDFYSSRVEIVYRLLGAFAVLAVALLLLSSLMSRWLVKVDAVAWPQPHRRCARAFSTILIVGVSALVPIYPMFKPFMASDFPGWLAALVLVAAAMVFIFLWFMSYRRLAATHFAECKQGLFRRFFFGDWLPLVIALLATTLVTVALWLFWWNQAYPRLLLASSVAIALTVVITAVSYGQNCRLQVQALSTTGQSEEQSTDFFLARIQTLGRERNQGMTASSASSAMTSLLSQDLSTIPAGPIMGTVARIVFALRPDMTWRAQLTRFDDSRVSMRLSRNGRLAATTIFSRADLGLAPVNAGSAGGDAAAKKSGPTVDQAGAQLVTGAAAFVLLHLSTVYPEYRRGLCGATNWKSVTLEAIAQSEALSVGEDCPSLLRIALDLDPGNGRARYGYISRRAGDLPEGASYDKIRIDMFRDLKRRALARKERASEPDMPKFGWEELYLGILSGTSVKHINQCLVQLHAAGDKKADRGSVTEAAEAASAFTDRCRTVIDGEADEQLCCAIPKEDCLYPLEDAKFATARRLLPYAKHFEEFAQVLDNGRMARKCEYDPYESPGLAYDFATLGALVVDRLRRDGEGFAELADELFNYLAFAVGTEKAKHAARVDETL